MKLEELNPEIRDEALSVKAAMVTLIGKTGPFLSADILISAFEEAARLASGEERETFLGAAGIAQDFWTRINEEL